MIGAGHVGQLVGLSFGRFLGRQIALGACRDDGGDDLVERRAFQARIPAGQLPPAVDLRPWMTAVEEQGEIGSCTANALAGSIEYLLRREGAPADVSRLFIYFNQRLWDDRVREDTGASVASGILVLNRLGVPRETSWPYQRDLFAVQPPEPVFAEAAKRRVVDWWSLPVDCDALRGCLAAGFPVVFGTRVTESFVKTPKTGLTGMPQGADDRKHGRHALLLVGYHDPKRLFVVRNSWGEDWGDRGYGYMPYEYVLNRNWTGSCWAIRLTTRDAYDPAEHRVTDLRVAPKAPPRGGAGVERVAGTVASMGAQVAVGALTGSALLGGLAGGLLAGALPGVASLMRGRDRGAYVDRDRSAEILALLRAGGAPPPALAPMPWDDGLDEEAARAAGVVVAGSSHAAAAPAAPAAPAAKPEPRAAPPAATTPTDYVSRLPARIATVWRDNGGAAGALGAPISEPAALREDGRSGSVVRFEKGAVLGWDPDRDAAFEPPFVLLESDPLVARWLELGAGRSNAGWPLAPPHPTPDRAARQLACTRGLIVEHARYGISALCGNLFVFWRDLGGFGSDLGALVADAALPADPTVPEVAKFERGTLFWSPARGGWRE
jgi:hypothetical protein